MSSLAQFFLGDVCLKPILQIGDKTAQLLRPHFLCIIAVGALGKMEYIDLFDPA